MVENTDVIVKVNPRARRTVLRIDPLQRAAILTLPSDGQRGRAMAYARENAGWIADQLSRLPPPAPFAPGGLAPVRGTPHALRRAARPGAARFHSGPPAELEVYAPSEDRFAARVRRTLIAEAREDLGARSNVHADALGVRIAGITVKDTRSRWGSCTYEGRINYSWRLICAPPEVLDYVAAHEVSHLIERNHGPRFWALVRRLVGDSRAERAWLRTHGASLFAVGAER